MTTAFAPIIVPTGPQALVFSSIPIRIVKFDDTHDRYTFEVSLDLNTALALQLNMLAAKLVVRIPLVEFATTTSIDTVINLTNKALVNTFDIDIKNLLNLKSGVNEMRNGSMITRRTVDLLSKEDALANDMPLIYTSTQVEQVGDPTQLMLDALYRFGSDPSDVVMAPHLTQPTTDVYGGLSKRVSSMTPDTMSRLRDSLLSASNAADMDTQPAGGKVPVLRDTDDVVLRYTLDVDAKQAFMDVGGNAAAHALIFQLMTFVFDDPFDPAASRQAGDTPVKVSLQSFIPNSTLRSPVPNVDISITNVVGSSIVATLPATFPYKVNVYAKTVSNFSSKDEEAYKFVAVISPGTSMKIGTFDSTNCVLYRFIPINDSGDTFWSDFSSFVTPTSGRHVVEQMGSLVAIRELDGMRLELRYFYDKVTSVTFYQRDLTMFENDFTPIDDFADAIQVVRSGLAYQYHGSGHSGHVYEYLVRGTLIDGRIIDLARTTSAYLLLKTGLVVTEVTDISTFDKAEGVNASFLINTRFIDTQVSVLKQLLEASGQLSYFDQYVSAQKGDLNKLLSVKVTRFNLDTGQAEVFGHININERFNDASLAPAANVQPLERGGSYIYEIASRVGNPSVMFDSFVQESVDSRSRRKYKFKPSKFMNPHVFNDEGMLPARLDPDVFDLGDTGSVAYVNVTFSEVFDQVINVYVTRLDRMTSKVEWSMTNSSTSALDHFIVIKDAYGLKTIVGRVHAQASQTHSFVHQLTLRDVGAFRYVIVPVDHEWRVGGSNYSDIITVDNADVT